jgi:hypothetical protein
MSIPIAAVVVASPTRRSIALHAYVSIEKPGQRRGERFVAQSGINGCIPEFAEKQMRDNRKRWGKDGTRHVTNKHGKVVTEGAYVQAYHVVQSFARDGAGGRDPKDPDAREEAHELGILLARSVAGPGRLATVTTQIDGRTGCIHNHIVIDSVDKRLGASFDSSIVKHSELVARHDRLLLEAGYEQLNTHGKGRERQERSELRGLARYRAWEVDKHGPEPFSVAELKHRVRETLDDKSFTGWGEFEAAALSRGVLVERRGEGGRGVTYAMLRDCDEHGSAKLPVSSSDRRRASKLGTDFTMDAVESAMERNRQIAAQQTIVHAPPQSVLDAVLAAYPGVRNTQLDDIFAETPEGRRHLTSTRSIAAPAPASGVTSSAETDGPSKPPGPPIAVGTDTMHERTPIPQRTRRSSAPESPAEAPYAEDNEPLISPMYRSRLRGVQATTTQGRKRIDHLAQLDEDSSRRLAAGGRLDEDRLRELRIGPRDLAGYGALMDPGVFVELERRQEKAAHAKRLYEDGQVDEAMRVRKQIRGGDYSVAGLEPSASMPTPTDRDELYRRHPELRNGDATAHDAGGEREHS